MSRFIPIGQKRLTNVSVVRLKRNGAKFEIACYRNTVIAYRNKTETDLDEVLHSHTVYQNVDKGVLAKKEDLIKAFGTDDQTQICITILNKGDFQVSEQERNAQLEARFKEIASRVSDMCLDPRTRLPYSHLTMERVLRDDLHFAPNLKSSVKQQALQATRQLLVSDILPIVRNQMSLRLILPVVEGSEMDNIHSDTLRALKELNKEGPGHKEGPSSDTNGFASVQISDDGDGSAINFTADPSLYRLIMALADKIGGSLQIIELKAEGSFQEEPQNGAPDRELYFMGSDWSRMALNLPKAHEPIDIRSQASSNNPPRARAKADSIGDAGALERRAVRMFKLNMRSAEGGDPVAQLEVGKAFLNGSGVDADAAQARHWLEQAASQGVNKATDLLATI